ncbi:MAG: calcium/sodium antiporter [Butyricicoccus pullicaecorum]|nr:calcium/sodium antiporter [Butyricicoccus pullicaecorum]
MMTVLLSAAFFTIGLYLTMRGGDGFVDAAAQLAEESGAPRFVVGATLMSVCTTLPELMVSVLATMRGASALAVGNAVGSAACNTGLILGMSALLAPAAFRMREARSKGGLMIAAAILLGCFLEDGTMQPGEALGLLAVLFAFLAVNLQSAAGETAESVPVQHGKGRAALWIHFFLGGMAVVLGARLMVDHGVILARMLGIPESIVGLTLVALGTSLPELMTALAAIRRQESALSVGNIVGANVLDLALVLPACTAAGGGVLSVAPEVFLRDLPFTVVLMGIAMLPPMFSGRMRRVQGILLLGVYGWYLFCLVGG